MGAHRLNVIEGRFLGDYDNGIGKKWKDPDFMKFYNDGTVNFPYLSDGMWFMTQHRRWKLLKEDPDYLEWWVGYLRLEIGFPFSPSYIIA